MTKTLIGLFFMMVAASATAGVMSDLHLQTSEAIEYHLYDQGLSYLGVKNMGFTSSQPGCSVTIGADTYFYGEDAGKQQQYCTVCFKEIRPRSFRSQSVKCQ